MHFRLGAPNVHYSYYYYLKQFFFIEQTQMCLRQSVSSGEGLTDLRQTVAALPTAALYKYIHFLSSAILLRQIDLLRSPDTLACYNTKSTVHIKHNHAHRVNKNN